MYADILTVKVGHLEIQDLWVMSQHERQDCGVTFDGMRERERETYGAVTATEGT